MVEFLYPHLFFIFIIPFIIFAFLITTNKTNLERVFNANILEKLRVNKNSLPLSIRNLLFFIALFLMIIAMARPVINDNSKREFLDDGADVIIALDISASMRSQDKYPNRLEFAKNKIKTLMRYLNNDTISLVAFASKAFLVAPFTNDTMTLEEMIDGIDTESINQTGTDFEILAELLAKLTKEKKDKIVVIFSDGGESGELEKFEDIVKDSNIVLFSVLIGTKNGSPVLDKASNPIIKNDGTIAISKLNEELGEVALKSNGAYVLAGFDNKDMQHIANLIHKGSKDTKQKRELSNIKKELFYYPLMLALVFLLISFSSIGRQK